MDLKFAQLAARPSTGGTASPTSRGPGTGEAIELVSTTAPSNPRAEALPTTPNLHTHKAVKPHPTPLKPAETIEEKVLRGRTLKNAKKLLRGFKRRVMITDRIRTLGPALREPLEIASNSKQYLIWHYLEAKELLEQLQKSYNPELLKLFYISIDYGRMLYNKVSITLDQYDVPWACKLETYEEMDKQLHEDYSRILSCI